MSDTKLTAFVEEVLGSDLGEIILSHNLILIANPSFSIAFRSDGTFESIGGVSFNIKDLENIIKICVYYKNGMHLS